jgi:hypothetical protein
MDLEQYTENENKYGNNMWLSMINPSFNKEVDIIAKLKSNLKVAKTITAILASIMILASQIEYETCYYKSFYVNKDEATYTGLSIRICYTIISFFLGINIHNLVILDIYITYTSFLIKRERKIISNSKF